MTQGTGTRLSPTQMDEIVARYQAGESSTQIGSSIGKSGTAVLKVLKRRGVATRDISDAHRPYRLRLDRFTDPLCEEARYWIGVLLSDGCVCAEDGTERIGVEMMSPHGAYLYRLGVFMGHTDARCFRKKAPTGVKLGYYLRSDKVAAQLAAYGVVPNKSHVAKPDERLAFDRHFWRGMIDGDGTIEVEDNGLLCGITGTEATCLAFAHYCHFVFPGFVPTVHHSNRESFCCVVHGEPAKAILWELYGNIGGAPSHEAKRANAEVALVRFRDRQFRVLSQGGDLGYSLAFPVAKPTLEHASAVMKKLREIDPSSVIMQKDTTFRNYTGELNPSAILHCDPMLNAASGHFCFDQRMNCSHRTWRSPKVVWEEAGAVISEWAHGLQKPAYSYLRRRAYFASQYNAGAVTAMLKRLGATSVMDPCAGWGDRMVGSIAAGCRYRGFDPNLSMASAYRGISEAFGGDASVQSVPFEQAQIDPGYDCVFTCPPYWDTENYGDDPGQAGKYPDYAAWRDGFYKPMIHRAFAGLKSGGTFVLTVANVDRDGVILPLIQDAQRAFAECGGIFVEALALQFRSRRGKKHAAVTAEPVLVFKKP